MFKYIHKDTFLEVELLHQRHVHLTFVYMQFRRARFDSWVKKIPWRREWLPTLVFLPGEAHGQRSLAGLQCMGS